MKKQKWHWHLMESTNRKDEMDESSGVKGMPDIPAFAKVLKSTKYDSDEDNSALIRRTSDEQNVKESMLNWEKTYSRQTYVRKYQKWEGTIVEIHSETFVAQLTDSRGERMPRLAKIKKSLINKDDWEMFFHEGFEFEWVFKEVITNGTFSRKNEIRFTPVTCYLPDEIDDMVKRSMSEFSYMLKTDD